MGAYLLTSLYQDIVALEKRFDQLRPGQDKGLPQPGSPWHTDFLRDYGRAARLAQTQLQTCTLLERFLDPPSSEFTPMRRYIGDIMLEAKDRAMGQCALLERMLRRLLEAGEACMGRGRPEKALELYRFGLELSPSAALLRFGECRALSSLDREKEAEQALQKALAGCPVTVAPGDEEQAVLQQWKLRALLAVGNHFFCRGDARAACMAYEAVLKSDPAYDQAHTRLEALALALEDPGGGTDAALETLPAADAGVLESFARRQFWTSFSAGRTDPDAGPASPDAVRAVSRRYRVRRSALQTDLDLHSPRVLHADGRGGVYVSDCRYADAPNRLLYADLRTGATRLLSTERFYTGLWLARSSGLLYGSLATVGEERTRKLDCMDAQGRVLRSLALDTPAYGQVGGPFRMAGDGLGGLLLLDTKKRRLLRYTLDDFSTFQVLDLGGWAVTPDLAVAGEHLYLPCPAQHVLLELPLRFGPSDAPRPVSGPQLQQPHRIAATADGELLFVVCSEELVVLESSYRVRFRYKLPPELVRDICLLPEASSPALALIQEMRGIVLLELGGC